MKPPRSLKILDIKVGMGRIVAPGDAAVCRCRCTRSKGELVYESPDKEPYVVRVGARDACVGIEYGLLGMQIGGVRRVQVPPNLTYVERRIVAQLPENAILIYEIELLEFREKWNAEM
ncbi:MAG: FKBP-type peptidyl-prolyl cis-trans isomerase [Pirellulales bacterium]